jgi:archaellum component FlaG (FlaF/FlaG flagellin family)
MKKIIFTLFSLVSISLVNAQTAAPATKQEAPVIKQDVLLVKEPSHDFGKIPQGRPATYVFEVVNTGNVPLKLDNVQASCGCTTPQWNKEDIAPGATSKITVGYNAYADGPFEKTITIQYNQSQTKLLVIKGNVYKAPPTSAPENASVKLLKQISQ